MLNIPGLAKKHFIRIGIIWIVFFVITQIALDQPHWDLTFFQNLNYNLFFIILLLSITIFLKDKYNSYIYLNFAILALIYLSGFFVIFTGEGYPIGDDYLQYYIWSYRKIAISIALSSTISFIVADYLFQGEKTIFKYLSTMVFVLPFAFFYYKKFVIDSRSIFVQPAQYEIISSSIGMNFLTLFFILVFGYLYLYRNQPITRHINLIIFSSLIYVVIDINDNIFLHQQKELPNISQLFLTGNLVLYILTFIDKIIYMDSEFGKFYDQLINSNIKTKLKIIPKKTIVDKYYVFLKEKLKFFPNRIMLIGLMVVSLLFFIYYFPFGYTKVNVLILITLMSILLLYLNILVTRRRKKKFIIKSI
jgi:hypothetical protein